MSGECAADSDVFQFFSQIFCINKASLSIFRRKGWGGDRAGRRKQKSQVWDGAEEKTSILLPKFSPESSPQRSKVPAMIAAAPPSADWQSLLCIFARLRLESSREAACLSQSPDPAG